MWLDTTAGGDLIEMDTATVKTGTLQVVNQVIRGADVMGIHFTGLGTSSGSACLCDLWDSSIPGLTEELGGLGDEVINAFTNYCQSMNEVLSRAVQLEADQAQVAASSGLVGGADPNFGTLMAQAIVNDGNNSAIGAWLGTGRSTSQVDILLAMQGQGGGGGNASAALAAMNADANDKLNKVWLAPDGTSYAGQNEAGRDLYRGRDGDVGTMNDIYKDKYDDNKNGSYDDYDVG